MLEHAVEARLLARCREAGFLCMKFTSPGRAGVPDRVVVTPSGTVFVETKRPGGKLRRLQEAITEKMRRAGAEVHVVDSVAGVDELVKTLAERATSLAVQQGLPDGRGPGRMCQPFPARPMSDEIDRH